MFTLSAMPVKFVCLLVLFTGCTLWELGRVVRSQGALSRTSHGLHLLMAVLMLAMVPKMLWMPLHKAVGLPVLITLMALGMVWFLALAVRGWGERGPRNHALACAGMFLAMVWHLWAMQLHMSHTMAMTMPMSHEMNHSMEMGPMKPMPMDDWMTTASRPGGVLWWFAVAGLVIMAWLLWVAVRDLLRAVRSPEHRGANLSGFAMNFGMFWMSTGLLTPVLPWFRLLSF